MPAAVEAEAEVIGRICREKGVRSFQAAKDKKEEESLWKARRSISPAISAARPSKIGEDISVPRSAIPAMVREIQRIAKEYDLPIVIFGHAGDGNLHPNILTDRRDHKEMERVEQAIAAIFEASVKLGGTLSGEHGIGLSKLPYMDLAVSKQTVKLMADIKRALDPEEHPESREDLEGVMEFAEIAALFKCNKCGSCTSVCPLYQNTVHEGMAARGKVALLEAVADGRLEAGEAVRAKLEDCLLCGACAANCPSFVPTTDLFLEARAGLAKELGLPLPIRLLLKALSIPGALAVGTPGLHLAPPIGVAPARRWAPGREASSDDPGRPPRHAAGAAAVLSCAGREAADQRRRTPRNGGVLCRLLHELGVCRRGHGHADHARPGGLPGGGARRGLLRRAAPGLRRHRDGAGSGPQEHRGAGEVRSRRQRLRLVRRGPQGIQASPEGRPRVPRAGRDGSPTVRPTSRSSWSSTSFPSRSSTLRFASPTTIHVTWSGARASRASRARS